MPPTTITTTTTTSTTYNSQDIPHVLSSLLNPPHSLLQPSHTRKGEDVLLAYDLDALRAGFHSLVSTFPAHFLHCFAVKAAPMGFIIEEAVKAGLGVEAASLHEVENALAHGCPPEKIVFDSPAKTYKELDCALAHGIHINANSLEEIERIAAILAEHTHTHTPATDDAAAAPPRPPSVGLRINSLVGSGKIAELSVSTLTSKFGVNLIGTHKEEILAKFKAYPWLCGLHIHVGSQGFDMTQTAQGIKTLLTFAEEVEAHLQEASPRLTVLDIGGGLSANYHSDEAKPTHADLAALLQETCPALFQSHTYTDNKEKPRWRVVTEYGRNVTAKTAWLVSRVEYAFDNAPLEVDDLRTVILHAGADILLRECYMTAKFPHRFAIYNDQGNEIKGGEGDKRSIRPHNLAGPLCFAGDFIGKNLPLPTVEEGDYLVVHDCGGYTLALFSRYCSRAAPAVVGYSMQDGGGGGDKRVRVEVLQERESTESVLEFWGSRRKGGGK